MASVPSSLLKRRSGPPAPPLKQGASDTNYPDLAGAIGLVINAGVEKPTHPAAEIILQERAEVQEILRGYAKALPIDSVLASMVSTLADATENLSPRALAVMSPVLVDLTVHAENAIVNGDVGNPKPISIQESYVKKFLDFVKTQSLANLKHIVTGLQDSLTHRTLENQTRDDQSERTGRDISQGYPHLIGQLSSVSETLATLGPVNWKSISEDAGQAGIDDIQVLLSNASERAYQRQQQLEVEAKAAHAVSFHALDSARKRTQQIELVSALLSASQVAISHPDNYQDLSTDDFLSAMKSAAEKSLTDMLKEQASKLLKRKKKAPANSPSKPVLMSGDTKPLDPNVA